MIDNLVKLTSAKLGFYGILYAAKVDDGDVLSIGIEALAEMYNRMECAERLEFEQFVMDTGRKMNEPPESTYSMIQSIKRLAGYRRMDDGSEWDNILREMS